ncbi:unnamed protein product [Protopolystoma xenopodis]|uniref:Serine-threonine/tyrosine-protein kinase catalytic domain-containing protein n=1 Tax=Protopolystoma xenopodis TaxID=117903 RepID=A0A3S5APB2_9PLAT|nr:unnamed protein product [Protopolystoma xenopodis]
MRRVRKRNYLLLSFCKNPNACLYLILSNKGWLKIEQSLVDLFAFTATVLTFVFSQSDFVHIKPLELANASLKTRFMTVLRQLREVRNENLNPVIGCFIDIASISIVFEHCPRGSLKVWLYYHNAMLSLYLPHNLARNETILMDIMRGKSSWKSEFSIHRNQCSTGYLDE